MSGSEIVCFACMLETGGVSPCPHCGVNAEQVEHFYPCLKPGTILDSKYLIGRALGQGGFGITYIGRHTQLTKRVAIKEYFPNRVVRGRSNDMEVTVRSDGESTRLFSLGLQQFREEGRRIVQYSHPNIVRAIDYFEANSTAYLVMEYVDGGSLEQLLRSRGGRLSTRIAFEIMLPVMDGLREVHESGYLHRDVKPANIYLSSSGQAILLDFGAAREALGEETLSLSVMLTPGYAPPEQYSRRGKQGPWSDIYACAATLYRCLCGEPPPDALERMHPREPAAVPALSSYRELEISPKVNSAIMSALSLEPKKRPQTMWEFQQALMSGLKPSLSRDATVLMGTTEPLLQEKPRGRGRRMLATVLLILALGAAASIGVSQFAQWRAGQRLSALDSARQSAIAARDKIGDEERAFCPAEFQEAESHWMEAAAAGADQEAATQAFEWARRGYENCLVLTVQRKQSAQTELESVKGQVEGLQRRIGEDERAFAPEALQRAEQAIDAAGKEKDPVKAKALYGEALEKCERVIAFTTQRKEHARNEDRDKARQEAVAVKEDISSELRSRVPDEMAQADELWQAAEAENGDTAKAADLYRQSARSYRTAKLAAENTHAPKPVEARPEARPAPVEAKPAPVEAKPAPAEPRPETVQPKPVAPEPPAAPVVSAVERELAEARNKALAAQKKVAERFDPAVNDYRKNANYQRGVALLQQAERVAGSRGKASAPLYFEQAASMFDNAKPAQW